MLKHLQQIKTTSKRAIQKTAEATGDLIGHKIAHKITNISRPVPQTSSKRVTNKVENIEHDNRIPKQRCMSPKKGQKFILMI